MHSPVQKKYATKMAHGRAASSEDESSLLDYTRTRKGRLSA